MKYLVKRIMEPDFGCEEKPEGHIDMDTVVLRSENGEEISVEIADNELYEKNINVGDWVFFDINHVVYKE